MVSRFGMSRTCANHNIQGRPCDSEGRFLPDGTPPPPPPSLPDNPWEPFADRTSFEIGELVFEDAQSSQGMVNQLLKLWKAYNIAKGTESDPPFRKYEELFRLANGGSGLKC